MKWIGVLTLLIFLCSCGGGRSSAPVTIYGGQSKQQRQAKAPTYYKVRKGDTLFSISWRFGLDYKSLARMNGIRSPYTIYAGQKLRVKATKSTSTAKKKTTKSTAKQVKKPATKTKSTQVSSWVSWRWPTSGKVISSYNIKAGRKGINIAGKAGQPIYAAAAGKVVYAGNSLARYGNLLIIKHNDTYLSAYAHNKQLLVKDGQWIKAGQKIATLGKTGTQRYQLHFEIRKQGKPVDPLRYLPKK